jgi:hypothetical protein
MAHPSNPKLNIEFQPRRPKGQCSGLTAFFRTLRTFKPIVKYFNTKNKSLNVIVDILVMKRNWHLFRRLFYLFHSFVSPYIISAMFILLLYSWKVKKYGKKKGLKKERKKETNKQRMKELRCR